MRNRLVIKDRGSSSSSSTPSSQLPHHPPHTRKPKLALLREVFGRGGFVLVIYIPATTWNAPLAAIFTKLLIMSLINHFSTEIGSCFIFYSLICLSRFGLLLASPSPLQPSVSWRHHVLRPARLRRLTFGPWERERVRGKDGEKGFVRVCDCKRENFLPNLRSLEPRGEDEGRDRNEWRECLYSMNEWMLGCVLIFIPQGLQKVSLRLMNIYLCPVIRRTPKVPVLPRFVVLFWLVWNICPLVDAGVWLMRLISIFLHWICWYQMY